MSSVDETQGDRKTAADTIAGLLAVGSIVLSAIAMGFGLLLQLDAHPARLAPVAIVAALLAARMSARYRRSRLKAALFGAVAWVVGMVVVIVTDGPLSSATVGAAGLAAPATLLQHSETWHRPT